MKKLILVRHGNYGSDLHLDETGRRQINALAKLLVPHVNGGTVGILTSPADRAIESALILRAPFHAPMEAHRVLFSDSSHPENLPATLELIQKKQKFVDVLVLVTHYEYAELFPAYFVEQTFNDATNSSDAPTHDAPLAFDPTVLNRGEAFVIDCEKKTIDRLALS